MGKWLDRLAREIPETLSACTLETIETPLLSVLKVPELRGLENSSPAREAVAPEALDLVNALSDVLSGPKGPAAPSARIYRLTRAQGDEAHTVQWDGETIEAFTARRDALLRRGYRLDDAEDLAERLALRDREEDDRRMCIECSHLGERGRCLAAAAGRLPGANRRLEPVPTILQRCEAFGLKKGIP